MKKIKLLIIEDNPITSQDLKEIVEESNIFVTGIARNKADAIASIENNKPDILLVDINLKGGDNGIELINQVNENAPIPFVYLTANSDNHTIEKALKTRPASYLTKPYSEKDVVIAIELAFTNFYTESLEEASDEYPSFIFLKNGSKFEKVEFESIQYIQADGSYTRFYTSNKKYVLSGNLNTTFKKIKNPSFIRTHRSYVANIENITSVNNDCVFIGEKKLPISRSCKEEVNRALKKI